MPSLEQDIENTKSSIALEKELLKNSLNTVSPDNNPFSNFAISLDTAKDDIKYTSPIVNSEGNLNLHEDGSYSVVDPISGFINKNLTREGALEYQAFNDAWNRAQEYNRTSNPVFDTDSTLGYLGDLGLTGVMETANVIPDVLAQPALYARNRFLEDQQFIDLQNEEKRLNNDLQVMNFKLMAQEAQGNVNPELMQQWKDANNRINEITRVLDSNSRQAFIDPETGQAVFGTTDYSVGGPTNRQRAYTAEKSLQMLDPVFKSLEADKELRRSLLNAKDTMMAEAQVATYAPAIAEKWDQGDYTGVAIDGLSAMYKTIWNNPKASIKLLTSSLPQMALAVANMPVATATLYNQNKAELLGEFKKNTGTAPTDDQISHIDNMAMLASLADTASDRLLAGGFGQLSKGIAATSKALDIPYRVTQAFVSKIPNTLKPLAKPLAELVGQPIQEGISGATTAYAMEAGSKPEGADLDTKKIVEQGILEGVAAGPLVGAQATKAAVGTGVGVARDTVKATKEALSSGETLGTSAGAPPQEEQAPVVDSRVTAQAYVSNPQQVMDIIRTEGIPGVTRDEAKSVAREVLSGIQQHLTDSDAQVRESTKVMDALRKKLAQLDNVDTNPDTITNNINTILEATAEQAKTEDFGRVLGSTIEALSVTRAEQPVASEIVAKLANSPYLSPSQKLAVNSYVGTSAEVSAEIAGAPSSSKTGVNDYLSIISDAVAVDSYELASEYLKKFASWGQTQSKKLKQMNTAVKEAAKLIGNTEVLKNQETINAQNIEFQNNPETAHLRIGDKGQLNIKLDNVNHYINLNKGGLGAYTKVMLNTRNDLQKMREGYAQAKSVIDQARQEAPKNEEVSQEQPVNQVNKKEVQDTGTSTKATTTEKPKETKPEEKPVAARELNGSKAPTNPTKVQLAAVLKYLMGEEAYRKLGEVDYVKEESITGDYIQYSFFTPSEVLKYKKINKFAIHKNYKDIIRKAFKVEQLPELTTKEETKDGLQKQEEVQQETSKEKDVSKPEVSTAKPVVEAPKPVQRKIPKLRIQGQTVTFEQAIEAIKPLKLGKGKKQLMDLLAKGQLNVTETKQLNQMIESMLGNNATIQLQFEDDITGEVSSQTAAEFLKEKNTLFRKLAKLYRDIEEGNCK